MARSAPKERLDRVAARLRAHVGDLSVATPNDEAPGGVDLILRGQGRSFALKWKSRDDAPIIAEAIAQLKRVRGAAIPMLAVPFMGESGRKMTAEAGISWVDLAGNASVHGPGLLIRLLDSPRPPQVGRPPDVFAPASSRLVRALLMSEGQALSHGDLVERSGLEKGRVSRLIPRLEVMGAVRRVAGSHSRPRFIARRPRAVLEAWSQAYDFSKHSIRRGFVLQEGRSADAVALGLMRRVREALGSGTRHAFTGLAGAWLHAPFATHRLVTIFVDGDPPIEALQRLGFHEEDTGANVWLVRPNDPSVYAGVSSVQGLPVAHPIQVYLDLKAQPERSTEAAEALAKQSLPFGWDKGDA
jgi:hypothetical protein